MRSIPSPSIVTNRESTRYHEASSNAGQLRDCCLRSSYDFPQISRALFTNQVRTCIGLLSRGCSDVVLLFLHSPNVSFNLISSSSDFVDVVMTNFIRMLMRNVFVNVFKSDAVIWCAAIFRLPSSMFDKLLHLSKPESFAKSCSRSHDLREAVGKLLTVTMYPQHTWSRFHRQACKK